MSKSIPFENINYRPMRKGCQPNFLEEARRRLLAAQSAFNEASEDKAIDEAIYALIRAEDFYRKHLEQSYQKVKEESK